MILKREELNIREEKDNSGKDALTIFDLNTFDGWNKKVRMFSEVELAPGAAVDYHVHEGEFESYYILSGNGVYSDNGEEIPVSAGTVTFTPSGKGHGLLNTGNEKLTFIALIVVD